jgi:ADP-ribosylglycohydrolase
LRTTHNTLRGAAGALIVALTISLAACGDGSERSAEAYCRAFYEKAAPIREHYVEANEEIEEDPLSALVTLLGAPGDLTVIFDTMAEHAPDEIKADTEEARDALKKQQDSLGDALSDPLGAIGSGLIAGLTSSGSFSRVDSYLQAHCPVDSELAQSIIDESR